MKVLPHHLIPGTVEEAQINYIIRDHDPDKFEQKKDLIKEAVAFMNKNTGQNASPWNLKDQYYNMRKQIEPHMHIVDKAVRAIKAEGITPIVHPIRGGTDGAQLSYRGLPCPNIFAGGHNFHGKMEYLPLESMEKAGPCGFGHYPNIQSESCYQRPGTATRGKRFYTPVGMCPGTRLILYVSPVLLNVWYAYSAFHRNMVFCTVKMYMGMRGSIHPRPEFISSTGWIFELGISFFTRLEKNPGACNYAYPLISMQ